ncbi:hypothetical protein O181_030921 [Austropuccinia psidii MF-1]|uniref:Uncharacterized protein n=1 Tax=Austropuccinia psidii MF-1 TaxID=1389203 RepID=A0A9Q3CTV4_9BASI|nr:hypothetical protein [Austropuccinia psidii MF-1]
MPKTSEKYKFKNKSTSSNSSDSSNFDFDTLFKNALDSEDQAERYQFGKKSNKNFNQSIQIYKSLINSLNQSQSQSQDQNEQNQQNLFDCHFNLARILIHWATTFSSNRSEIVEVLIDGIQNYQKSIQISSNLNHALNLIDSHFNLASAISNLAEILSQGAIIPNLNFKQIQILIKEHLIQSKIHLSKAFDLQKSILDNSSNENLATSSNSNQIDSSNIDNLNQNTIVHETFLITPSVLIDTLIDLFDILFSIYPFDPISINSEFNHYLNQIQNLNLQVISTHPEFNHQFQIENLICYRDLTILDHKLSTPINDWIDDPQIENHLIQLHQNLINLSSQLQSQSNQDFFHLISLANNLSTLSSTFGSFLLKSSISKSISISSNQINQIHSLFKFTLDSHSSILLRLKNSKLQPIKLIQPHQTPSYIASSLIGQSELLLIFELLQDFFKNQFNSFETQNDSWNLAIQAYNQTFGPFLITPHSDHHLKLIFKNRNPIEERNDWSCFSTRLEAIKSILRSKWLVLTKNSCHSSMETFHSEILPLAQKFKLISLDASRFLDDCEHDPVWLMTDGRESLMWETLKVTLPET